MRIKHRYVFDENKKDVIDFLSTNNIYCEMDPILATVELYEDDKKFNFVSEFLAKHNIFSLRQNRKVIYTNQELEKAEWLSVRSTWRSDYPQPDENMGYRFVTYDASSHCEKCGKGLRQKDFFILELSSQMKHFIEKYFMR